MLLRPDSDAGGSAPVVVATLYVGIGAIPATDAARRCKELRVAREHMYNEEKLLSIINVDL